MAKKEGSFSGWLQRVRRTGEFSDVKITVEDQDFLLHMLPLQNECSYFRNLPKMEAGNRAVKIPDLPGGAEAFAIAADFCYLIKPTYNFGNIASIRAVAEFLGMADLLDSTKKYFYTNVFSHWRSCVSFLCDYKKISPAVDEYVESRCVKVITSACSKGFMEAKHVSVPIPISPSVPSSIWQSSPCHSLTDVLVTVCTMPDEYILHVIDLLVESEVNLNIKCRQGRNVRSWLKYLVRDECKTDRSRCWVVFCLSKMLVKGAQKVRPWMELASQYWCSLLEQIEYLLDMADDIMRERLDHIKSAMEQRIGAGLNELDDYLHTYKFMPETILALAKHFVEDWDEDESDIDVQEVAAEIDSCLWSFSENAAIAADEFIAIYTTFPSGCRKSDDALFCSVNKMLSSGNFSEEDVQQLWRLVDCEKLSAPVYEQALSNPSFLCQPHVLESVLQRHNEELANIGDEDRQNLRQIMQKVIKASLKLLEENSRRSKEIMELQKQYAALLGGKICPFGRDSCENSPDSFKMLSSGSFTDDTCSDLPVRHSLRSLGEIVLQLKS